MHSIRSKLIASMFAVVFAISAFVLLYYPTQQKKQYENFFEEEIASATETVALAVGIGLSSENYESMHTVFAWAKKDPSLNFIVISDTSGEVVAAYPDTIATGLPVVAKTGLTKTHTAFVYCSEIRVTRGVFGYVVVSKSLGRLRHIIATSRLRTILISAVMMLLGCILVYLIATMITGPIKKLTEATREIAAGNYEATVNVKTRDETGELASTFNKMVSKISAYLKQITRHAEELERKNRELEEFSYVASHDLQEPLRKVASFGSFLLEDYADRLDAAGIQYIQRMQDAAARMKQLIQDLLQISRVATRGQALAPVDAQSAVVEATDALQVSIEEAGAEIKISELPRVLADRTQLTQLFQNLIGNAVKFRRQDVPPVITVGAARNGLPGPSGPSGPVLGPVLGEGAWVTISVSDNGIGIEERFKEKVFEIFQRLHSRDIYPGTGIGLALCKKIVERHGGKIWCESEYAKGSTFYFTLRKDGAHEG